MSLKNYFLTWSQNVKTKLSFSTREDLLLFPMLYFNNLENNWKPKSVVMFSGSKEM